MPEVKTLREKLGILCAEPERARAWSSTLARDWMEATPESAGTLYIDGHVRVYHGALTRLPRRYVSRERLCLRGTTDYWVNAMDGQPFFVVTRPVDDGLLSVLKEEIVPRLQTEVPGQPGAEELAADPLQHRFTIVFDREGYSPKFFSAMREKRIAVLTYHKFPGADWGLEEFSARTVRLVNAEEVTLELAERGVRLSNGLWVREVHHRDVRGHQSAILSTDYRSDLTRVAAAMFARWCQENFFKYMQQHYGIDRLVESTASSRFLTPPVSSIPPGAPWIASFAASKACCLVSRPALAPCSCPWKPQPERPPLMKPKKASSSRASRAGSPSSQNSKPSAKTLPNTSS